MIVPHKLLYFPRSRQAALLAEDFTTLPDSVDTLLTTLSSYVSVFRNRVCGGDATKIVATRTLLPAGRPEDSVQIRVFTADTRSCPKGFREIKGSYSVTDFVSGDSYSDDVLVSVDEIDKELRHCFPVPLFPSISYSVKTEGDYQQLLNAHKSCEVYMNHLKAKETIYRNDVEKNEEHLSILEYIRFLREFLRQDNDDIENNMQITLSPPQLSAIDDTLCVTMRYRWCNNGHVVGMIDEMEELLDSGSPLYDKDGKMLLSLPSFPYSKVWVVSGSDRTPLTRTLLRAILEGNIRVQVEYDGESLPVSPTIAQGILRNAARVKVLPLSNNELAFHINSSEVLYV